MRVVYDISTLGLAQRYPLSRCGAFRVDEQLPLRLLDSGACELQLCANHSSVAYQGSIEYLRGHPRLAQVPLLGPGRGAGASAARALVASAHGLVRRVTGTHVMPRLLRGGGRMLDRGLHRPVRDGSPPADIFHTSTAPLPPVVAGRRAPRRFLTLYDLAFLRLPELYGPAEARGTRDLVGSLREGDSVLTTSAATRDELDACGVAARHRVFVVPLAADPVLFRPCGDATRLQAVRQRYGIPPGPYVLSVNSLDPRKHTHTAVRAFGRLARQEGVGELSYVLAGPGTRGAPQLAAALDELDGARARVIQPGYVRDEDLAPLYSGALAFVYPSIYEGFGLPPLEAMQCGAPVITANTSSLPEVVGEAGMLVDAGDADALAGALLRLYQDSALREELRARSLARAALFSWERCLRETLAAYRAVLPP